MSDISHSHNEAQTHEHHYSDTVQVPLMGTVTVAGGIYTIIFGVLGALTLAEVLVAELLKGSYDGLAGTVRIAALLGIGVIKSILVVWFYMHLGKDHRILRLILLVPVLIVLLATLYLLGVPTGGGGGYLPAP